MTTLPISSSIPHEYQHYFQVSLSHIIFAFLISDNLIVCFSLLFISIVLILFIVFVLGFRAWLGSIIGIEWMNLVGFGLWGVGLTLRFLGFCLIIGVIRFGILGPGFHVFVGRVSYISYSHMNAMIAPSAILPFPTIHSISQTRPNFNFPS